MSQNSNLPVIRVDHHMILPDNDQWTLRFDIHSETSNRIYTIAQHKIKKHWGCSCMGWKRYRTCKHLAAVGLPAKEKPFEVNIQPY